MHLDVVQKWIRTDTELGLNYNTLVTDVKNWLKKATKTKQYKRKLQQLLANLSEKTQEEEIFA